MKYDTSQLQQMTGQPLCNNLKLAFGAIFQEEQYQANIDTLQNEQKELQASKKDWKFRQTLKTPPQWMKLAILAITLIVGYLTVTALWGDRRRWAYSNLEPLLAGMLAVAFFQAIIERDAIVVCLKKVIQKLKKINAVKKEEKNKSTLIIAASVSIVLVAVKLDSDFFTMLLWWILYAAAFGGTYRFMGYLECNVVHTEQWKKKTEANFLPEEENLKRRIVEAQAQLRSWKESDLMAFAHALVPDKFLDTGNLAILINLIETDKAHTLSEGIAAYGKQKFTEEQRELLKEMYWKQVCTDEKFQQQLHTERYSS